MAWPVCIGSDPCHRSPGSFPVGNLRWTQLGRAEPKKGEGYVSKTDLYKLIIHDFYKSTHWLCFFSLWDFLEFESYLQQCSATWRGSAKGLRGELQGNACRTTAHLSSSIQSASLIRSSFLTMGILIWHESWEVPNGSKSTVEVTHGDPIWCLLGL